MLSGNALNSGEEISPNNPQFACNYESVLYMCACLRVCLCLVVKNHCTSNSRSGCYESRSKYEENESQILHIQKK